MIESLCSDVILGLHFQTQHKSVTSNYGGDKPSISIYEFNTLNILVVETFRNVSSNIKPIITKSRRFSNDDNKFICSEVRRLLKEGIIEPSQSSWKAQVVMAKEEKKKRLLVDYTQTINRFTLLNAFPLPNINELVNKIAQFRVLSIFDLKSACHQLVASDFALAAFRFRCIKIRFSRHAYSRR